MARTNQDQFKEKLDELVRLAHRSGERLPRAQVSQVLQEAGLDNRQLRLVCTYLEQLGIEVTDAGGAMDSEELSAGLSLSAYLEELNHISPLPEETELSLFARAAAGDREARDVLTERYLPTVCDLAGEFEHMARRKEKVFEATDLIQEANIGLILGLDQLEEAESLAGYRAALLNAVTTHLEEALQQMEESLSSERKVVNRMNRLAQAAHDLEEQLEHKPSLEELSAYLELPAQQITDLLRMGGENLRVEDL